MVREFAFVVYPRAGNRKCVESDADSCLACVVSVSVRFRSKEQGTRVKDRAKNGASKRAWKGVGKKGKFPSFSSPSPHFHFLALVSFIARPKPRIPFLGLSLLRNQTDTLATLASHAGVFRGARFSGMKNELP